MRFTRGSMQGSIRAESENAPGLPFISRRPSVALPGRGKLSRGKNEFLGSLQAPERWDGLGWAGGWFFSSLAGRLDRG